MSPVALAVGAEVVGIGSCADAAVTRRLNLVVETVFLGVSDGVISAIEGKPDLSASVVATGPTHEGAGLDRRARLELDDPRSRLGATRLHGVLGGLKNPDAGHPDDLRGMAWPSKLHGPACTPQFTP